MKKLLVPVVVLLAFLLASCGGGSSGGGNDKPPAPAVIAIADSTIITAAEEAQLVATMTAYTDAYFKAMVTINSFVLADLEHMNDETLGARLEALIAAADELEVAGTAMETFETTVIEPALAAAAAAAPAAATKAVVPNSDTPDLYHAKQLVDLWMNDEEFYKKYKLSDISKKTLVPIKRLRLMAQQMANEFGAIADGIDAEIADAAATRVEMIRDGAAVAGSALAIYSTGGAWAAATTTVQKGVVVLQGVTNAINITDTGLTFAYGDEKRPAIVEKISAANNVTSIILGIATLDGTKLNKAVTLIGTGLSAKDTYIKLTDDQKALVVSDTPESGIETPTQTERASETFDDYAGYFLLPGDYRLPNSAITGPQDLWDDSFLDTPPADVDAFVNGEQASIDNFILTWNPDTNNPVANFDYQYVAPPQVPEGVVHDIVTAKPDVVDPPALTVSADVTSGEAPLTVVFTALLENADPAKTYTYTWSVPEDNVGADATDATLTHTFVDPGPYTVTATASTPGDTDISASIDVNVSVPAPWAAITPSPATANIGQQVTFKATHGNMPTSNLVFKYEYSDGAMTEMAADTDYHTFSAAGNYTVTLTVKDATTGTVYATANGAVTVALAPVTNLQVDTKDHTSVTLKWSYSGSASFNVYADNVYKATATASPYKVRNLLPETYYCFNVAAEDNGIESAWSSDVCTTTLSDFVNEKGQGKVTLSTAKSYCQAINMRLPTPTEILRLPAPAGLIYWTSETPFAGFYTVYDFTAATTYLYDSLGGDTAYFACIY